MAKFIVDIDNLFSKSMIEMILENELDCKVSVNKIEESIDEDKLDELADANNPWLKKEEICNLYGDLYFAFDRGFKAGYKKAKEE